MPERCSCGRGPEKIRLHAMRFVFCFLILVSVLEAAPVVPAKESKAFREIMAAVADPVEDAVHQKVKFHDGGNVLFVGEKNS